MEDVTDALGLSSFNDDLDHITPIEEEKINPEPNSNFIPDSKTVKIITDGDLWTEGERLFRFESNNIISIIQNDAMLYQEQLDQWCKTSAQTIKRMAEYRNKVLAKIKSDNGML